jgi:uncharacterized protein Yka (UPF0111/DUF47 family)
MLRVTKKEAVFFKYFSEMIDMAHEAAIGLEDLMTNYTDTEVKVKAITEVEHRCDLQVHLILQKLNAAFITPIDREDIYSIAKELDEIVDHIEETACRFIIYNIKEIKPAAIEVSKLLTQSVIHLQVLIKEFVHVKVSQCVINEVIEINRLENVADEIYRNELTKLFSQETNAIELIKWEGIYTYLEKAIDSCEYVTNIIEGVVMKHA